MDRKVHLTFDHSLETFNTELLLSLQLPSYSLTIVFLPGWPLEFDALDVIAGMGICAFLVRLCTLPPKDCVGVYSGI